MEEESEEGRGKGGGTLYRRNGIEKRRTGFAGGLSAEMRGRPIVYNDRPGSSKTVRGSHATGLGGIPTSIII